jgi:hypothetical protein
MGSGTWSLRCRLYGGGGRDGDPGDDDGGCSDRAVAVVMSYRKKLVGVGPFMNGEASSNIGHSHFAPF